jgi:hypothetical protein
MKNKQTIKELREQFSGKGGDQESESILVDANADKKEGFLTVWSDNATIAKILDRCGSLVLDYHKQGGGYSLKIDRRAFRGLAYSFKRVDNKQKQKEDGETEEE